MPRFQSIGVTKEWRPGVELCRTIEQLEFPINRRHQGLATQKKILARINTGPFPINRRHQGLATLSSISTAQTVRQFPINRRHQGLATAPWAALWLRRWWFPINRRHEGLATFITTTSSRAAPNGFQSIGVTKDWRLRIYLAFRQFQ